MKKEVQATEVVTPSGAVIDNGPSQIAALAEQVQELKETVNVLIAQIQMLRSEVKKTK